MRGEFAEGDKACKRGNQRTHAADIYPQQQLGIIPRELWKQNRRGNVADDLAGANRNEQSIFL